MTRRAGRATAALVAALGLSLVVPGATLTAGAENRTYVYKSQTIRVSGDETSTTQVNATNDGSGAAQRVSVSVDGSGSQTRVSVSERRRTRVDTIKNVVKVENRRDGRVRVRTDFDLDRTSAGTVKAVNGAYSYASCTGCQTGTLAIQVVVSSGGAAIDASNEAIAVNEVCDTCDTFAGAFQVVVAASGDVKLSRSGRSQLREVSRAVRDLRRSGASGPAIAAAADGLAQQVVAILRAELIYADAPSTGPEALARVAPAAIDVQLYRSVDTSPS